MAADISVEYNKPGPLIATVSANGTVTPEDESTAWVRTHVKTIQEHLGLTGQALLDRLERSYTNGYIMARIEGADD